MRLGRLCQEFPDLKVEHKAFVLVPEEGSRPVFTDYHLSNRRAAAERTGLPFAYPKPGDLYPRSSWPSQGAAAWVREAHPERFALFDDAVFRAFFQHNLDIADLAVLAQASGIPELGTVPKEQIAAEHLDALQLGIRSIPSVLFGSQVVSGAVEYEEYKDALKGAFPEQTGHY